MPATGPIAAAARTRLSQKTWLSQNPKEAPALAGFTQLPCARSRRVLDHLILCLT